MRLECNPNDGILQISKRKYVAFGQADHDHL